MGYLWFCGPHFLWKLFWKKALLHNPDMYADLRRTVNFAGKLLRIRSSRQWRDRCLSLIWHKKIKQSQAFEWVVELAFLRVASQGLSQPSLKTFAPVFPSPTDFLWVSEDITGIASIGKKAVFFTVGCPVTWTFHPQIYSDIWAFSQVFEVFLQIFDNSNGIFLWCSINQRVPRCDFYVTLLFERFSSYLLKLYDPDFKHLGSLCEIQVF